MTTFNPRRFVQVDVLRQLDQKNLLTFLMPHAHYLSTRGFAPVFDDHGKLDLEKLASILLQPTETIDDALVEALFLLHELSDEHHFEELCRQAEAEGLIVNPESSPADIALLLWLKAPAALRRFHVEALVVKPKTFFYFQSEQDAPDDFTMPNDDDILSLANAMDEWFMAKKRGTGARIIAIDAADVGKVYFLIRHGMPFKRESKIEHGESSAVFYRPEYHDVVIYDRQNNELAIFNKSGAKGECLMYVSIFGERLFGHSDYFVAKNKFTLDPLIELGRNALASADIDGIDEIKLIEIQTQQPSAFNDFRVRRSNDFFAMLDESGEDFEIEGKIHSAKFSVKFSGSQRPRTVSITPPRKANYDRNEDAYPIEQWLKNRGFAVLRKSSTAIQTVKAARDGEADAAVLG